MTKFTVVGTGASAAMIAALGLSLAAQTPPAAKKPVAPKPAMAVAHKATPAAEPQPDLTKQYCIGCHSEKAKAGGLSLVAFDSAHADQHAAVAEKVIQKLRLGMMPPPGARRPEAAVLSSRLKSFCHNGSKALSFE